MKRFVSVLFIVVMSLSLSISSLGAVASFSSAKKNLASSSNAIRFQNSLLQNSGISLLQSDDFEYGTDWYYFATYTDPSGISHTVRAVPGQYAPYVFDADYNFYRFGIAINKSALPSAGTYGFTVSVNQGSIDMQLVSARAFLVLNQTNAQGYTSSTEVSSWDNTGTAYAGRANVEITSSTTQFQFAWYIDLPFQTTHFDVALPTWNFTLNEQSDATDVSSGIPDNTQGSIASGVDNIASGVESMQGTLEEIVQTISLQLEALWNQLYNYIHVPQLANDDKNTGLITDSIDTMGSDVVDSVDSAASDITSNVDSNAQAIQDNADQNTNTITNGYDNSGIDSDNDRLSDKLDEYGQQEDQLMEDVSDGLSGIDFDVDFDSILSSIQLTSDFLQDLYDASGGKKIDIIFQRK